MSKLKVDIRSYTSAIWRDKGSKLLEICRQIKVKKCQQIWGGGCKEFWINCRRKLWMVQSLRSYWKSFYKLSPAKIFSICICVEIGAKLTDRPSLLPFEHLVNCYSSRYFWVTFKSKYFSLWVNKVTFTDGLSQNSGSNLLYLVLSIQWVKTLAKEAF